MEPEAASPGHMPEPGDVYRHRRTFAPVIVLSVKGQHLIRLGRPHHGNPMETDLTSFLERFEWLELNILTKKERYAFGVESG